MDGRALGRGALVVGVDVVHVDVDEIGERAQRFRAPVITAGVPDEDITVAEGQLRVGDCARVVLEAEAFLKAESP